MMENSKSASEAAHSARELFQDPDNAEFWPGPLVRQLENTKPKLALRWAIRLFQELLPVRRKAGPESTQRKWLADLSSMIDREDAADHCNNLAAQIWDNDPNMNFVERGIARLYWASCNYQMGLLEPDYYKQVMHAVGLLADNGGTPNEIDEMTFNSGIALFHRLLAKDDEAIG
jgi:hypothetical protein